MMKMEIKKNCTCDTDIPKLEYRKCLSCGLVDIINAEWYRTDRGFICRYCYDKKRTYVEINAVIRISLFCTITMPQLRRNHYD